MERKEYRKTLNEIAEKSKVDGVLERYQVAWQVEEFLLDQNPDSIIGVLKHMNCYEDVMNDLVEKMASNLIEEIIAYDNLQNEIKRFYPEGYEEERVCK